MRKVLPILVCLFALSAWVVAQDKDHDKDKDRQSQAERITNGPVVEHTSSTSATIAWSTNAGGSSIVKYGSDPNNLNETAEEPYHSGHGTHRVKISNLKPGTTYYYQVISGQGQGTGTQATSQVGQFTTPGQGQGGGQAAAASPAAEASGKVPLYRATNPKTGGHLLTDNQQELQSATSQYGFQTEGVMGYIMSSQGPGTVPLYRFRNSNGDHLYLSDASQAQGASKYHYTNEGVAGYIASSQQPGTVPLYRLVNPTNGQHTYTSNPTELQQLSSQGWRNEGAIGYIWSS